MSLTLPPPGSSARVLRHLKHLQSKTNGPGGKFLGQRSFEKPKKYVQPKDRIAYWNISPGDEVKVTVGGVKKVDIVTGEKTVIPYEGIVTTVDRERNLVWLRAREDAKDETRIPRNLKHVGSRLKEPEKGEAGGYTPNTAYQIRPVHYSNLQLRLPENTQLPKEFQKELDLKKGVYASRLTRSNVGYSARYGHFIWRRFGTVQTSDGSLKLELPWKVIEGRDKIRKSHASNMHAVDDETWIPWDPTDPFKLLSSRKETSEQAIHRIQRAMRQRAEALNENAGKVKSVAVSAASGRYEGFAKSQHVRMPLIPQAPTASEQLYQARQDVAKWLKDDQVEKHKSQGGRTFTAMDYIDSTPIEGPSDAQWNSIATSEQSGEAAWNRDSTSGKLKEPLSRRDMDSWPVELLMVNDLTNPTGLRNRMRAWNRKQAEKREVLALKKVQDDAKVKLLREWVTREEAKKRRAAKSLSSLDQLLTNVSIKEEASKDEVM